MKKATYLLATSLLIFMPGIVFAEGHPQKQVRKHIRNGNKNYYAGKRQEAQVDYFKAYKADTTNACAIYNLATSMFPEDWKSVQSEQRPTMISQYVKAAQSEGNPNRRAMAYHNAGVLYQGGKDFKMAIEAYKEALRNNPNDEEARYNLVLCKHQLKDDDQNRDGQDKNDNGQQNKDEQQQQQDEQQKQQNQQEQSQQEQKPPMSKENAEQMLNAAMQQEKQTQQRMKQQQSLPQRRQIEKNW